MSFSTRQEADGNVITLTPRDLCGAEANEAWLDEVGCDQQRERGFVIDLTGMQYLLALGRDVATERRDHSGTMERSRAVAEDGCHGA